MELGVDAPEVVLAPLVAALDLDAAHRQRPPVRAHRAELAALLGLEHQIRSISTSNTFCMQPTYVRPSSTNE